MSKILLIDDNIDICETICDLLNSEGFELKYETDARKGIEKALCLLPDLILCDMRMSTPDEGFYVLSEIKKNGKTNKIPFLFYTIVSDISVIVKGLELGAQDYIVKTDPDEIMLARIKVHLKLSQDRIAIEAKNHELNIAKNNLEKLNYEVILSKNQLEKINYDLIQQIKNLREQGDRVSIEDLEKIIKEVINRNDESGNTNIDEQIITKEVLLEMIAQNNISQVFLILKNKTKNNNEYFSTTINLINRFNEIEFKNISGTLNDEEYSLNKARLYNNIIKFINLLFAIQQ